MGDRPLIFSAPMVLALLDGRKTQTRRILSNLRGRGRITEFGRSNTEGYDWHFRDRGMRWHDVRHARLMELLAYQPGDRLWVREAFAVGNPQHYWGSPIYRATFGAALKPVCEGFTPWRPPIHIPRWASRLTLVVEAVRVERLQDISEEDARAEGITHQFGPDMLEPHKAAFAGLWNSLHGPDAWGENPVVVAITFRVHRCNIDQMEAEHG